MQHYLNKFFSLYLTFLIFNKRVSYSFYFCQC
nr:MAG TPA: hypothetical protein [Caudoviricetes sp.]